MAGARIYTPDGFDGYISGWSTSSQDGSLTPISGSPWVDQGGCSQKNGVDPAPHSVAVDGTGKFLYVNHGVFDDGISIYSIGSDGALTYLKTTQNFQDVRRHSAPMRRETTYTPGVAEAESRDPATRASWATPSTTRREISHRCRRLHLCTFQEPARYSIRLR